MNVNSLDNNNVVAPKRLYSLHSTPENIYTMGHDSGHKKVTIIGSRRPTHYGIKVAQDFAAGLAEAGVGIVSGLAIGIDGIAQQAALDSGGYVVGILPSCIHAPYPARHRGLAQRILDEGGLLVSEYADNPYPRREHFIARNRLLATWSDLVLVIEATVRSGTQHTVNFALESGVDVAAIPGPVTSLLSAGPNKLIQQGAQIATSIDDVLSLLGVQTESTRTDREQHELVAAIQRGSNTYDLLLEQFADSSDVFEQLIELEARGIIARTNQGVYAVRL